jgi:hypothetical protein
MIRSTTCHLAYAVLLTTTLFSMPAFAQAPTDTQRAAIRSECRSDYEAHCASIPPGGAASLECLQKNMASLSAGCASAVRAVGSPTESSTESKPAPGTEPAPAAATAAPAEPAAKPASAEPAAAPSKATGTPTNKPSSEQIAAVRTACRSDYPKVCAGVPTGGAPALQCLEKNEARLSANCKKAVIAATGGVAAPASAGAAPATATATPAAPATVLVLRPLRPREVLFVLRSACGADARALCAGVEAGGGRIAECLASHSPSLSPACRAVLAQFAAR